MTKVLFCELSGSLVISNAQLNSAIRAVGLPQIYLLSPRTAVTFVEDDERAASIIRKGAIKLDDVLLEFFPAEGIASRFTAIHLSDPRYELDVTEIVKNCKIAADVVISSSGSAVTVDFKSLSKAADGHKILSACLQDNRGVRGVSHIHIAEHRLIRCRLFSDVRNDDQSDSVESARIFTGLKNKITTHNLRPMIAAVLTTPFSASAPSNQSDNGMPPKIAIPALNPAGPCFTKKSRVAADAKELSTDLFVICPTEHDAQLLRDLRTVKLSDGDVITVSNSDDRLEAVHGYESSIRDVTLLERMRHPENASPDDDITSHLTIQEDHVAVRRISGVKMVLKLDLECYAIANYFKLLLKWGSENANFSEESSYASLHDEKTTDSDSSDIDTALLWGEEPERIGEPSRDLSSVTVILENKARNYGLIISSYCPLEAAARVERMAKLAATAVSMRQTIPMRDWCPQHREAINESEALSNLLNTTKSAVLFHESKDRIISADVVGLTEPHQRTVRLFLEALIPRHAEWVVPHDCVSEYSSSNWIELRRKFAIKLDVKGGEKKIVRGTSSNSKGTKSLKVWGFEPSMDLALRYILGQIAGSISASVPQSYLVAALTATGIGSGRRVVSTRIAPEPLGSRIMKASIGAYRNKGPDDLDVHEDSRNNNSSDLIGSSARDKDKDKSMIQAYYVFLDREAGMLYQAFEMEFQAYISQAFKVSVKYSQSTVSESGTFEAINPSSRVAISGYDCTSQNQAQNRTPALRIDFYGHNKKDITAARTYLEKINLSNLSRHQIHFPRYDATRYRELYNEKTKQEANVRMIKRHSIQQANTADASETEKDNEKGKEGDKEKERMLRKSIGRDERIEVRGVNRISKVKDVVEIMPDPLTSVGFINIRIRPPLHSRGIRRMTFPAEITITVCSPVNTEPQLADYTALCEHFTSMDSHYITASVEIPLASPLAKEIIVRWTREEFITKYGLVSLRWDENSFRRDCGSMHNHGVQASSSIEGGTVTVTSTTSPPALDNISPCLRSASELKKEDTPTGVVKLWTVKSETMKCALDRLCKADGIIISVSMGDKTHSLDADGLIGCPLSLSDILPSSSATGKFRLSAPTKVSSTLSSTVTAKYGTSPSLPKSESDALNGLDPDCLAPSIDTFDDLSVLEDMFGSNDDHPIPAFSLVPPGFDSHSSSALDSPASYLVNNSNSKSHSTASKELFSGFSSIYPSTSRSTPDRIDDQSHELLQGHLKGQGQGQGLRREEFSVDQGIFRNQPTATIHNIYPRPAFDINRQTAPQPISIKQPATIPVFASASSYNRSSSSPSGLTQSYPSLHSGLLSDRSEFPKDPLPSAIKAAPGLHVPTDWDSLLKKVECRTPPSSSIPRALTPSFAFKKTQYGGVSERDHFPQQIDVKSYSYDGFHPPQTNLLSSSSPSSAFASVKRDRALSLTSIASENSSRESVYNDPYMWSPNPSHFRESEESSRAASNAPSNGNSTGNGRYIGGISIFNDNLNLDIGGTGMSADLGDASTDAMRPLGLGLSADVTSRSSSLLSYAPPVFEAEDYAQSCQQQQMQRHQEQHQQQHQLQLQHQMRQQQHQHVSSNVIDSKVIVHWPHPSLRFMFLGDPLKYQLSDLLHKFRARGVGISTPMRDKSNPSACLIIEGTSQSVSAAKSHVESYFRSVIMQVRGVTMVLTASQREKLTTADLARVKEIQGSAGAHIVLDPQLDDLSTATSSFDIRLPFSDLPSKGKSISSANGNGVALGSGCESRSMTVAGLNSKYSNGNGAGAGDVSLAAQTEVIPLIAIRVVSQSGHTVVVSVIPTKAGNVSSLGDTSWDVSSVLMLIDATSYSSLSLEDRMKIDSGRILVNRDQSTGRMIIRVWTRSASYRGGGGGGGGGGGNQSKQRSRDFSDPYGFRDDEFSRSAWHSDSQPQMSDNDAEFQAGVLIEALSDGLAAADALSLTRMALVAPVGNTSLSALSADLIRTITVEASVNFLKGAHLQSLQKIVCVDLAAAAAADDDDLSGLNPSRLLSNMNTNNNNSADLQATSQKFRASSSDSSLSSGDTALSPAAGNRMALTLLLLLDQAHTEVKAAKEEARKKSYNPNSLVPLGRQERECFFRNIGGDRRRDELESYEAPTESISLIVCNVPLPCTLSAESVCPEIILLQQQQRNRNRAATSAYSGLGYDGSVLSTLPLDGSSYGHSHQRDFLRDQISDYRHHTESEQNNPCVIMLRGLPVGIIRAVRAIRLLVAMKSS